MLVLTADADQKAFLNGTAVVLNKVIAVLEGDRNILDDILLYAPSLPVLKKRTRTFLHQCRHHGVTLKQTKSQLAVTEADFGVFRLSSTEIQTSLDLLKSTGDFPEIRLIMLHNNLKEKRTYDQHSKVLPPLQPGSHVAIPSRTDTD